MIGLRTAGALLTAILVASPATAQSGTIRAELAAPLERGRQVIINGTVWNCSGTVCTARGDEARPAVACRKLARKVGPIARFVTPQAELDAAGLAACNQDRD